MIVVQALQWDGKTWRDVNGQPPLRDMAEARAWLAKRTRNHVNRNRYQFIKR